MDRLGATNSFGEENGPVGLRPAPALLFTAGFLLLFTILFRLAYKQLLFEWTWEDYNYCYFVPVIVLYLLWDARSFLLSIPALPSWRGPIAVALGVACYFLGEFGGEYYVIFIGSWLVMIGFAWACLGWQRVKAASFPLLLLIAMFPFPTFVNNNLTLQIKLISSRLGVLLMQWYGLSAYREGNVIDLGFTRLQVVDACSGMRYLFPLILLALLLAHYFDGRPWKKMVLVLSAVPVSVVTNGLRIASVGILYQYFGPVVAEGFFHEFSGWFIFMFSLGLLVLEMRLLRRIGEKRRDSGQQAARATRLEETAGSPAALAPTFAACALIMVAAIGVSQLVDFSQKVPVSRPLAQFPLRVGEWGGTRSAMEKEYLDTLRFDDYLMVDFKNPQGKAVSLYTAYYGSQSKGEAIHSPASCLPGGGWVFKQSGVASFPAATGAARMEVSRAYMQKNGSRMLTYYWFPQCGRIITNIYALKLYTFWNALTCRRTDGSLVRIITPVYESEQLADADARLQGFTRAITPVLASFLPR